MLTDILLTVPVALLFLAVALRCLWGFGLAPGCCAAPGGCVPARPRVIKVFCAALALRLFLLLIMFLCSMLSGGEGGLESFPGKFSRWDAGHYINLIEKGYSGYQEDGRHLFLVFYPLYVWAARLVRLIIPNTVMAGLMVSLLSYAGGCCYVYKIAAKLLCPNAAKSALLLLSLYPHSFFFGLVMTEGLFLLTTSAACYYALERRWLLYGLWGALAALTRMTGVLVIVMAAVELLSALRPLERPLGVSLKKALPGFLNKLPALLMPLLGSLAYLLLNWRVDGDPFAFRVHQGHWHQGGKWISGVLKYLWSYFWDNKADANGYAIWLPELVIFAASFGVLLLAVRKKNFPPSLLAYAFCYLVANYSLSWLLSAGRYMSCCFPLFLFAGGLLEGRESLREGICLGGAALTGVYLYAYLTGAQVM